MKKILLSCLFAVFALVAQPQVTKQGYLGSFKHQNANIDVKWANNLSDSYKLTISPQYLKELSERLNSETKACGLIFTADSTSSPYEMIIKPEGSSSGSYNTKYTFIEKATGYVIATIVCKKQIVNIEKMDASDRVLYRLFSDSGNNLGKYIYKEINVANSESVNANKLMRGFPIFNYRFDFSTMTIEGADAKEYVAVNVYQDMDDMDKNYALFCKKIELTFITGVNKNQKENGYKLDNKNDERFEIVFKMKDVTEKGGHKIEVSVIDKVSNRSIKQFSIKKGNGKLNTFQILLMEQLAESSEEFGESL